MSVKIVEQTGKYITTKEVDSLLFKDFRRPLIEILTDLRKPIAPRFLKHKQRHKHLEDAVRVGAWDFIFGVRKQ